MSYPEHPTQTEAAIGPHARAAQGASRRNVLQQAGVATLGGLALAGLGATQAGARQSKAATQGAPMALPRAPGDQKPLEVGMLLYPGLTMQDLVGPYTFLNTFSNTHLAWKTRDPIISDSGMVVTPSATLDECPRDLDVLFVPGGPGMIPVMRDEAVMGWLADRGSRAKYVTSVCTGSMVLGQAGLLKGYKATSHWAIKHLLPTFGAIPTDGRVVTDRNRMTGGGVTAGMDFGLTIVAALRGEEAAKFTQLGLEYDPHPPFHSGTPEQAGPAMVKMFQSQTGGMDAAVAEAAADAPVKRWV